MSAQCGRPGCADGGGWHTRTRIAMVRGAAVAVVAVVVAQEKPAKGRVGEAWWHVTGVDSTAVDAGNRGRGGGGDWGRAGEQDRKEQKERRAAGAAGAGRQGRRHPKRPETNKRHFGAILISMR